MREVVIVFDSDKRFNPRIQDAEKRLAKVCIKCGWNPFAKDLPDIPGLSKTGVDDFLLHHAGARRNWIRAEKAFDALARKPLFIPNGLTAAILSALEIPTQQWIVPNLLPVGLSILAGPPKVGKSFLVLHIAVAVSTGNKVLDTWPATSCEVLYLALEDSARRLQLRLRTVAQGMPMSGALHLHTQWPRVEDDGLRALEMWLDAHPACRCVLIDTFALMRMAPSSKASLYAEDYAAIGAIKRIADARGIAILLVHHLRKATDDDPLNMVSGSTGVTGAADAILVLKRSRSAGQATLYATGRDIQELDVTLGWDGGLWKMVGETATVQVGQERAEILTLLENAREPITATQIAQALGRKRAGVTRLLGRMADDGIIEWRHGGRYLIGASSSGDKKYV